jgi:hypothetical protein
MFECPNCGEPLEDGAESCPHCGSDEETGWNPDVDYYAVELPEDEEEETPPRGGEQPGGRLAGYILLALAGAAFLAAGWLAYGWGALLALAFLAACIAWFGSGWVKGA